MDIQEAKTKIISWAEAQIGYREGENNYNKYGIYLEEQHLVSGSMRNEPWCGSFVLAGFAQVFGPDKALEMLCSPRPSGIPLCSAGATYFKNAGRWHTTPAQGDIIFFIYNGGINHTGIITRIVNGLIYTVEGNSSDMVARRTYVVGSSVIAGFGRPRWTAVAEGIEEPVKDPIPAGDFTLSYHTLRRGDGMGEREWLRKEVEVMQILLIEKGYACGGYGHDGEFGRGTEQSVLNYQYDNGLEADGVVGPATRGKLEGVS